jgi:hypothetical protein
VSRQSDAWPFRCSSPRLESESRGRLGVPNESTTTVAVKRAASVLSLAVTEMESSVPPSYLVSLAPDTKV